MIHYPMLREKIAELLVKVIKADRSGSLKAEIDAVDRILSLFRQEIEKLGVISDEEIDAAWPSQSGLEPPWETEDLEKEIIRCCRAVVQAQLQDSKDTLLRMIE